jgi:transposase
MLKLTPPALTKKDRLTVKKRRLDHPNKKLRIRYHVLWLTTICDRANEIALIAGVSTRSVFDFIKMYNEGGLDHMTEINHYSPTSKLEEYSDIIQNEFEENPPASIREAKHRIKLLTGIKRSETQVRKFLKKLGMRLLKPGVVPMGKNESSIEEKTKNQKKYVKAQLAPVLSNAKKEEHSVLFMDACHVQLACLLGFIWCFVKKYIKALPIRGRMNVIGACSPYGNDFIYDVIQDKVDQYSIAMFLVKVRDRIKTGKITLVLDNAQYHKTVYVEKAANKLGINLLFLPVASPNLNIIERLWKFIKKSYVANTVFSSLNELEKHLKKSLSKLKYKHKNKLRSLLTTNFQYFDGTRQFVGA